MEQSALTELFQQGKFSSIIRASEKEFAWKEDEYLSKMIALAYDQYAQQQKDLEKKKRYEECARFIFNSIIKMNPKSSEAMRGLGLVYLHEYQLSKSLQYYKKAFRIDGGALDYLSLGNVYRAKKQKKNALLWYGKALKISQLRIPALMNLMGIYREIGDERRAAKYESILKRETKSVPNKSQWKSIKKRVDRAISRKMKTSS